MDRRTFVRVTAVTGAAAALAACDAVSEGQDGQPGDTAQTPDEDNAFDPVSAVAPDADEVLSVISASFEQLVGTRPFAFGVVGPDNEPVTDPEVELWVVPTEGDGEPAGPFAAQFNEVPGESPGVYFAQVEIAEAGPTAFVAVTDDGQAGTDIVQVATPQESQLPAPGQEAMSVATPTGADPLGYEELCTDDPDCGMHGISLEEALAQGRRTVVTFATPAYCQTAVCGPSVDVLDEVRASRDWGDIAFIHVEIYTDAGETVADPVSQWQLPSEPWLFTIDADGQIVDRADGPLLTLADQVTAMVERLA